MDEQRKPSPLAAAARSRTGKPRIHPLSYAAIATAIVAGPAFGTGFQGNFTINSGSAQISRGATADTIDMTNSSTAVIDWSPSDTGNSTGPITFLPTGNSATYQSTSGNFTVLNRIAASNPARAIEFDGHVVSQYYTNSGPYRQGGNVWFYAPGGIILGGSAVFDVGSLLLTTNAITLDANNNPPNPATGISFRGGTDSRSLIDIQSGARINADVADGSYVAIVAPRISQAGNVQVEGSAGYIAAEQADMTISNGLFNISFAVGSKVNAGGETTLTHTGTTGGPSETPTGTPQNIYMIAIPKNDAVTALVSGNVGYDAAASASEENGAIVLGAAASPITQGVNQGNIAIYDGAGSITIPSGSFTSRVTAYAHDGAIKAVTTGGDLTFTDADFYGVDTARADITLGATSGHNISASGSIGMGSNGLSTISAYADANSTLDIAGSLGLETDNDVAGASASAAAAVAKLEARGTVHVGGDLYVDAGSEDSDDLSTAARGGTATVLADGGSLTVDGEAEVIAEAEAYGSAPQDAFGGTVRVATSNGGSIMIGDLLYESAGAFAGDDENGNAASATGGTAILETAGSGTIAIAGATVLEANAAASYDEDDDEVVLGTGTARGGAVRVSANGGTITMTGGTGVGLDNDDGNGEIRADAGGSTAIGGSVIFEATAGGTLISNNATALAAQARGITSATGGNLTLTADDGTLTINDELTAKTDSSGDGNISVAAGNGTGGMLTLAALNGGAFSAGASTLSSDGTGGTGPSGIGGTGTGGTVQITAGDSATPGVAANAGTIGFTSGASADATGSGASGDTGGLGQGGTVRIDSYAGSVSDFTSLSANGTGGSGVSAGGAGTGGTVAVNAVGGDVTLNSFTTLATFGSGGFGSTGSGSAAGGDGGPGTGGSTSITASGSTILCGICVVEAASFGGAGGGSDTGPGGTGGEGRGGTVSVTLVDGTIGSLPTSPLSLLALAIGEGGSGGTGGSTVASGGAAIGGHGVLAASGASQLALGGSFDLEADADVADASTAGAGTLDLTLGSASDDNVQIGDMSLVAGYTNVNGGSGLIGTAGTINLTKQGGAATINSLFLATGEFTPGGGVAGLVDDGALGGSVNLTLADGSPLNVVGDLLLTHAGPTTIAAVGSGGLVIGGALTTDDIASLGVTHESPAGPTITAASADIDVRGAISAAGTSIRAGATEDGTIKVTAGTTIAVGDLTAGSDIDLTAPDGITTGALTSADTIELTATGPDSAITTGALSAGANGSNGDPEFAGNIAVGAGESISLASAQAFGDVALLSQTGGTTITGATSAGGSAVIFSDGDVTLGDVSAGGLFYVGAAAAVNTLFGADYVLGQAQDPVADVPALIAGGVTRAGRAISTGAITASQLLVGATGGIAIPSATVTGAATFDAGGALDADGLGVAGALTASGDSVTLAGPGALNVTSATVTGSSGSLSLTAGTTLTAGDLAAGGGIVLVADSGLTTGKLTANNSVSASSANGALAVNDVESVGGMVSLLAGGNLTAGNVRAAGSIYLTGGAAITAGDLTAGTGPLLAGAQNGSAGGGAGPAGIASGFTSGTVTRCDDCNTEAVALPFTVNYFGQTYTTTYVSSNGYLTFTGGSDDYTPQGLGTGYAGLPIIAPFFADVDTSSAASAQATYGTGMYAGHRAFGATFDGVGYFDAHSDKLNHFQVILTDRSDTGAGNFDIYYNYGSTRWETGDFDDGTAGLGGNSAAVGYNAGTGNQAGTFYELPGSRVAGSFIDGGTAPLATSTNDGVPGQLLFSVRNGQVSSGGASEPATIHVSNTAAAGNTSAIKLGNLSAEAAEVHGAGQVTVGNVTVADRGSGIAAPGVPFATVLDASNGLISGDISGAGFVALGGGAGDVSTASISTSSSVAVLANGAVTLGSVSTGASDTLYVSDPGSAANDPGLAGFSFATLLGSKAFDPTLLAVATPGAIGGTLTLSGPVTAGTVLAGANRAINAGAIAAATKIALNAGQTISLAGAVTAPTIALRSGDIAIGDVATVGDAGTTSLTFTSINEGAAYIGDGTNADEDNYLLDAAELGRVQSAAITIDGGNGGLTLGDITLHGDTGLAQTGRANILGSAGTLAFTTGGAIQLVGALDVSNLSTENEVSLTASQITGILPNAGIRLSDASGGLAGALTLAADRIAFTSQSAADAIATMTSLSDISDRLATNDGPVDTDGYIRANGLTISVGSGGVFNQNSGTGIMPDDRAGITVGDGGLTGLARTKDAIPVVLNGRQVTASGTLTGRAAAEALITGEDDEDFTASPGSTINGCPIDGSGCQAAMVPAAYVPPVQDVIAVVTGATTGPSLGGRLSSAAFENSPLVSFADLAPTAMTPLIDEPVTGAGNDDLWGAIGFGNEKEKKGVVDVKPASPAK